MLNPIIFLKKQLTKELALRIALITPDLFSKKEEGRCLCNHSFSSISSERKLLQIILLNLKLPLSLHLQRMVIPYSKTPTPLDLKTFSFQQIMKKQIWHLLVLIISMRFRLVRIALHHRSISFSWIAVLQNPFKIRFLWKQLAQKNLLIIKLIIPVSNTILRNSDKESNSILDHILRSWFLVQIKQILRLFYLSQSAERANMSI